MAKKIRLTRPELKRQRDRLRRFERYLPTLKLKQQQLQLTVREIAQRLRELDQALRQAEDAFAPSRAVMADVAGVNVERLATPDEVRTGQSNVAGVNVPTFEEAVFPRADYSLFATPPWVDRALADLRELNRRHAELRVVREEHGILQGELVKITQRVNLFEKVMIPEAREAIRRIRIHLGDEMTAAVGRAKIAKAKLTETGAAGQTQYAAISHEEPDETDGDSSTSEGGPAQ